MNTGKRVESNPFKGKKGRGFAGWWIRAELPMPDLIRQKYLPPTRVQGANRAARRREWRENWAAWVATDVWRQA